MKKMVLVEIGEDLLLVFAAMFMAVMFLSLLSGGYGHNFLALYLSLFLIGVCELVKIGRKIKEEKEKYQGGKE